MDPVLIRNRLVVLVFLLALVGCLVVFLVWVRDDTAASTPTATSSSDEVPPLGDVMPITDESYEEAASVVIEHAALYGSYSPGLSLEEYRERLQEAAAPEYQEQLEHNALPEHMHALLAEEDSSLDARVRIQGVDDVAAHSITFIVTLESVPEASAEDVADEDVLEHGEFSLFLIRVEDVWQVSLVAQDLH